MRRHPAHLSGPTLARSIPSAPWLETKVRTGEPTRFTERPGSLSRAGAFARSAAMIESARPGLALGRCLAHPQALRSLARRQPLDVPQHQRRAIVERQSPHRPLQRGASLDAFCPRLRRRTEVLRLARRLLKGYGAKAPFVALRAAL